MSTYTHKRWLQSTITKEVIEVTYETEVGTAGRVIGILDVRRITRTGYATPPRRRVLFDVNDAAFRSDVLSDDMGGR